VPESSRYLKLKSIGLRKVIHVSLSALLLVPYLVALNQYGLTPTLYYALLATTASVLYAAQVKKPILTQAMIDAVVNARQVFLLQSEKYPKNVKDQIDALSDSLNKFERNVRDFLEYLERDYEKRGGYLGILMGSLGVLLAQVFSGNYVIYGILSVMIYDTMSAVGGVTLGRLKIPLTNSTVEGSLIGMLSLSVVLFALTRDLSLAFTIPLTAAITETIGIEDNFTIPLTTSVLAMALKFPLVRFYWRSTWQAPKVD